jgi:5-methylthioadenosine/S-adenosylhomocysteine deaminase
VDGAPSFDMLEGVMRRIFALGLAFATPLLAASCQDQENPRAFAPLPDEDAGVDADTTDGAITGDPSKGILMEGTVIGEDDAYEGMVLVGTDGKIACAEPGDACANDPKAEGAARFNVVGVIAPGLIDTHNHILFDFLDGSDWLPEKVYTNHDDWPDEQRYKEMSDIKQCLVDDSQGKPTWCPMRLDGTQNSLRCEVLKYGEMKAVVSGTTSVTGLSGTAFPCFNSLARSIDTQFNGFETDFVQTAAITPSAATANGVCANYATGKTKSYIIHVAEGTDQRALNEWTELGSITTTPGCLYAPQTAITHGTALGEAEFTTMGEKGMKLVWSPASNMALYAATTNVPLALDKGILVAVAPDWSMGGSPNMLDELRAAKKVSDEKWGGRLKPKDLVTMGTKNAAIVLAMQDRIGTIKKGLEADLFVVPKAGADAYESILAAHAKDVRLTMIAGKVIYGDEALRPIAAFGPACEDLELCGVKKFACVSVPGTQTDKLNQRWADITTLLDAALLELDEVRVTVGGKTDGLKFSPIAPLAYCPK